MPVWDVSLGFLHFNIPVSKLVPSYRSEAPLSQVPLPPTPPFCAATRGQES